MAEDKIYATKIRNAEDEMPPTADEVEAEKGKAESKKPKMSRQQVGTAIYSLLLMGIGALIMHTVYPAFHPVTFKKVKDYYAGIGEAYKGIQIEELNKACPDGEEITLSCISLVDNAKIKEISQAFPAGFQR